MPTADHATDNAATTVTELTEKICSATATTIFHTDPVHTSVVVAVFNAFSIIVGVMVGLTFAAKALYRKVPNAFAHELPYFDTH
tara:strand:- start:6184 stop:6435 length:252 start_codon:yes stop_codon:yes gene_type:complete